MKPTTLLLPLLLGAALPLRGEIIPATEITPLSADSATVMLGGNRLTITGIDIPEALSADLSGPGFESAPLGSAQPYLVYRTPSKFQVRSQFPITGLMVYAVFFRGISSGVPTTVYAFDRPLSVFSGLVGAQRVGSALVCPDTGLHSGILRFPGRLDSFSIDTNATSAVVKQGITFAIDDSNPTVTAPARSRLRAGAKRFNLRGTAAAPIGIRKVEVKAGRDPFREAKGREAWQSQVRLAGKRTLVQVRAISASGKVSAVRKTTVLAR